VLLTVEDALLRAQLLCRPSKRNRAPYVGDILLPCGREAIAHFPSLDLGGKCLPGHTVLVRPARDSKGRLVGPGAVSPKYGTPKCEFICQAVECREAENEPDGCLVGAHPRFGELIAARLLLPGTGFLPLSPKRIASVKQEVTGVAGCNMRSDFVVSFEDGSAMAVEVKTVVDTDFAPHTAPVLTAAERKKRCVYVGNGVPYQRAAIFPWGTQKQLLDPNDKSSPKVVSTRAIKHVRELTLIASGQRTDEAYPQLSAAVLFIVVRDDAKQFRPNHEACPQFAAHLSAAKEAGVVIAACQVAFELDSRAMCNVRYMGTVPIDWRF